MQIEQIPIQPTKSDQQKGRWLLDSGDNVLPKGFVAVQSAIVGFAPNGWAANHHHSRKEILLPLAGELYLIWRDEAGNRHEQAMIQNGQIHLFVIAPHVPHLVENRSATATGALYEWSDTLDESILLEGEQSLRREAH